MSVRYLKLSEFIETASHRERDRKRKTETQRVTERERERTEGWVPVAGEGWSMK